MTAYPAADAEPGKFQRPDAGRPPASGIPPEARLGEPALCSAMRCEGPRKFRCAARQFCAHGNPSSRGWTHHQKGRAQQQPLESHRGGGREHRGDDECCEVQHGDHDVPPVLRLGGAQCHGQAERVENTKLMETYPQFSCGHVYTPWLSRRVPSPVRLAEGPIGGSVERQKRLGESLTKCLRDQA